MKPFDWYQQRLDRVSRSFALCIPQLQAPFREQVALAYLLLRVLDTVEDAPFTDKHEQSEQFERLRGMLVARPTPDEIQLFATHFPILNDAERSLVDDTAALFEDAWSLDPSVRLAMFSAIDRMAEGMAAYTRRPTPLHMVDVEDVTRYCCFVAGLVGEMLTRLWKVQHEGEPAPTMALAYQFGVFLQKVNILKDQQEDEAVGRFFVPDRQALLASLRIHAQGALQYIQALPPTDRGYRIFCAWSLMMGASTISSLDVRTSRRDETVKILQRTAEAATDNAALGRLLAELMPRLPELSTKPPLPKPESPAWFKASLAAPLNETELQRLGLTA
ncbi:MAG: squalene/phytoene synthase family protein [Kofleriaceae bacterium]